MKLKKLIYFLILITFGVIALKISYKNKTKKNSQTVCNHCNILLMDIDTLRADELPCYGYSRNTAPNICAFANKSVIFDNNYSPSYWTLPSIFSTITSLYPTFHRVKIPYIDKLSSTEITLAKTLHDQGYKTVFVGPEGNPSTLTKENGGLVGYDLVTSESIDKVISELSKNSQPWFVHYYKQDLHMPYLIPEGVKPIENLVAPKDFSTTQSEFDILLNIYFKAHYSEIFQPKAINKYASIIFSNFEPGNTDLTQLFYKLYTQQFADQNGEEYIKDVWKPIYNTYLQTFDPQKPSDVAYLRMMYDTMINQIDKSLVPLFKELNSRRLSQNTVTIIMSDHGEAFGQYGTFGHDGNYHTESFYTPLIIHAPNLLPQKVKQTTSNIDIFPTILSFIGSKSIDNLQGISLAPYINSQNSFDRFVFSEDSDGLILLNKNWLYFLPNKASSSEASVLYDKISDPKEKINVASKYPDLTDSLYKQINILRSYEELISNNKLLPDSNVYKLDPVKIKRLQKEGYF